MNRPCLPILAPLILVALLIPLGSTPTNCLAEDAPAELPNPFFVLENGVKCAKFPTPEAQADVLAELGYAGIGPSGTAGIPRMLAATEDKGLKVYGQYVGAFVDGEEPKWDAGLPEAIRQLAGQETCVWLTLRSRRHPAGSTEADEGAVEVVRELAELCRESKVRIALYPHAGFYVERVEQAVRIANKVDRPNVGVTFNLCHWLKVEGPGALRERLEQARPRLFLVTINGADTDGTGWQQLIQPLDSGTFETVELLRILRELDYNGPIGLQCYGVRGDKQENLQRSITAWQRLSIEAAR